MPPLGNPVFAIVSRRTSLRYFQLAFLQQLRNCAGDEAGVGLGEIFGDLLFNLIQRRHFELSEGQPNGVGDTAGRLGCGCGELLEVGVLSRGRAVAVEVGVDVRQRLAEFLHRILVLRLRRPFYSLQPLPNLVVSSLSGILDELVECHAQNSRAGRLPVKAERPENWAC